MKAVTIGEFKRRLPELLKAVEQGEKILLQRGRRRESVAMLTPCPPPENKRPLGLLAERGEPKFRDWEITEEDFLHPL